MNILDLRNAQARFVEKIETIIEERKPLHQTRKRFITQFDKSFIAQKMNINDYVIGVGQPNNKFNFCYTIERSLDKLGRIIGSSSFKFGLYYGKTKNDQTAKYRFTSKFGNNLENVFINIRLSLLELLKAGETGNYEVLLANKFSPMFKGKILATYFPETHLNVFSDNHLDFFLNQLDLDNDDLIFKDAILKRKALIKFKNGDPIMKGWSLDLFSVFLYTEYPGRPPKMIKTLDNDLLSNFKRPLFPNFQSASFVDLAIDLPPSYKSLYESAGKIDYQKEEQFLRLLGDRGEKIVMELEESRLKSKNCFDLAKRVDRVSLRDDCLGFDILSFNEDGNPRYIEVKATTGQLGSVQFYLTENERLKALELDNYYVYIVFAILSKTPQVWMIPNPFNPKNDNVISIPIKYKICIKPMKT